MQLANSDPLRRQERAGAKVNQKANLESTGIAVELRDVVKRFGEVTAVDHVSIRIKDGEFFSLLGPSGCGKTTTLRMIAGFEMATSGQILIEGQPQGYLPPHRRPVNTVFQNYALFPHMNVYDNVAFGLQMQGIPKKEIVHRVMEALELVHLKGMQRRRPRQLSGPTSKPAGRHLQRSPRPFEGQRREIRPQTRRNLRAEIPRQPTGSDHRYLHSRGAVAAGSPSRAVSRHTDRVLRRGTFV